MKKKIFLKVKRYLVFAMAMVTLLGATPMNVANAAEDDGYIDSCYDINKIFSSYVYDLYKDYGVGIHFPSMASTVFHTQGGAAKTVSLSNELSLSISTAVEFNKKVGGSYGIKDVLTLTAEKDYGFMVGLGIEFSIYAGAEMYIESSYKSGYYRIEPAIDGYQYHYNKYKIKNNVKETTLTDTDVYYMTEGNFYYACMYSKDGSSWSDY